MGGWACLLNPLLVPEHLLLLQQVGDGPACYAICR